MAGALVYAPLSILISGFPVTFVPGPIGLILNLICPFINGFGVEPTYFPRRQTGFQRTVVSRPTKSYFVDLVPNRRAEAVAAHR